ncbi:ETX/MTX2 family pore-forming toxin [Gaoshiqia sp. Z1-71]|uniref:ETX/MTX2 family pore-forming toxin n=1 Tax=Gaoshiqia hydrogeniformans TaxID=3290090 RepID=UPI003BF90F59
MKKVKLLSIVFLAIYLFSCSIKEEYFDSNEVAAELSETFDKESRTLLNEMILPIEGDRDTLNRPQSLKAAYDIQEEIDQLDGISIYLQVQGNSSSKQFLNATDKGVELTVADYAGNLNQQFYIRVLPATTGIPYLIYSKKTETPIRIGTYTSQPNVKVLYASREESGSLFGASWDFRKAQYSSNSFVIENQDYPEQGSGGWWDIYYNVITVNDAKISFSKYSSSPRQEFAFVPVETFQIEEIRFNVDASAVLERLPDVIFSDGYTNNGPIDQSHSFTISETYKETSTFSRKTSYNVSISTEVKVKVPFIASGTIKTSTSFGQDFTYGNSEEKTFEINRTYPVIVPANHRAELNLTLFKYNMDVEYVAVCRGLTSGKRINIKGRWIGVDCLESDAVLDVFPISGLGTRTRTVITEEMLKSNSPIRVR